MFYFPRWIPGFRAWPRRPQPRFRTIHTSHRADVIRGQVWSREVLNRRQIRQGDLETSHYQDAEIHRQKRAGSEQCQRLTSESFDKRKQSLE